MIWVDVEDIFVFAEYGSRRPNGIQRLAFELCQALQARCGDQVGFLRHDRAKTGFVMVEYQALAAVFAGLSQAGEAKAAGPAPAVPLEIVPPPPGGLRRVRRGVLKMLWRLPERVREPVVRVVAAEWEAMRAFVGLARMVRRRAVAMPAGVTAARPVALGVPPAVEDGRFAARVEAGDVLFAPGAAFMHPTYAAMIARARAEFGIRFALLIYDVIPLRRPEYTGIPHALMFKAWVDAVLPLCDRVFAISRSAASETEAYAKSAGVVLRHGVQPIPIGTGFSAAERVAGPLRPLPAPGSYALIVSTIEVRKNHLLLLRVWRRLLDEMPAGQVPKLVFAGGVGWMVADLMQQLENTAYLDGHVVLVEHPSDDELAALYRGCLFTLFPSFYEGWGLPVSESLAFGKPCIISDASSLPEVGGDFARYIDPDDVAGAARVIRATIEDRAGLLAWEARIGRDYRPVPWDATARAVLEALAEP